MDDEEEREEAFDVLVDDLNSIRDYDSFVRELETLITDPKIYSLLAEGFGNGTFCADDMQWSIDNVPVQRLLPSQNEIGLSNSIAFPLTGKCGVDQYFNDGVEIAGSPIITYEGSFVIDGHHRWSQVYMINPDATMKAINFTGGTSSPWKALRDFQGAIAVAKGEVPNNYVDCFNVYDMGEDEIRNYIEENMVDSFWEGICEHTDCETREDVIDYLMNNILDLQAYNPPFASDAPDRDNMPQTDEESLDVAQEGVTDI